MKRIPFILLVLSLAVGACSRPLPATPTSPLPTKGAAQDQVAPQATPLSTTPTPVKVALITATPPAATASPTPTQLSTETPSPTPTPLPPPEGIVTGDAVNLRSGPDTGYAIIGEATLSQTVHITARDFNGEWWQICCPNEDEESAWISAEFVQTTLSITQTMQRVPTVEFPQTLTGVVTSGEINLRSGPGTQYDLIGEILLGGTVEIIGRSDDNNWWQIKQPANKGQTAWIYSLYIVTNFNPADAKRRLPVIESPPPAAPTPTPAPLLASTHGFTLSVTGVISGDIVNLREGPGTEYALAGRVTQSQTVQVVGQNEGGDWRLLCCQGDGNSPAWISAEFVLLDDAADLSQIPVITTTVSSRQSRVGGQRLAASASSAASLAIPESETENEATTSAVPNAAAENALPAPGNFNPPGAINPLTGRPLPARQQQQRPIIVCINNDPQARPQHGTGQADVMYEYLVEGYHQTRFSGIFYGQNPPEIGPVRSARLINYYMGALYNAPLFCSGASDAVRFILKDLAPFSYLDVDLDDGNNTHYSKSVTNDYRTRLRTSAAGLRQWTDDWGIERPANIRGFTFGALPGGGLPATEIAIPYARATGSNVSYTYNSPGGRYLRFLDDRPHTDANTGRQITVENVIVQYVVHQSTDIVEDSLGSTSIRLDLFGSGKAIIFRDGVAFPGAWRSDTQGDTPRFFDQNGREIPLKPGKTWISVVPDSYEIEFQ